MLKIGDHTALYLIHCSHYAGGSRAVVQQDAVEAEARHVVDDLAVRLHVQPHARHAARADEARQLQ